MLVIVFVVWVKCCFRSVLVVFNLELNKLVWISWFKLKREFLNFGLIDLRMVNCCWKCGIVVLILMIFLCFCVILSFWSLFLIW